MIADLAEETGLPFTEARNHFEAQGGQERSSSSPASCARSPSA